MLLFACRQHPCSVISLSSPRCSPRTRARAASGGGGGRIPPLWALPPPSHDPREPEVNSRNTITKIPIGLACQVFLYQREVVEGATGSPQPRNSERDVIFFMPSPVAPLPFTTWDLEWLWRSCRASESNKKTNLLVLHLIHNFCMWTSPASIKESYIRDYFPRGNANSNLITWFPNMKPKALLVKWQSTADKRDGYHLDQSVVT